MREHAAEGPAPEATEDVVSTLAPPAPLSAPPLTVQGLLGIQRRAGNRAAAALVARAPTATADGTLSMGATGSAVTALQMHLNLLDEVKTELVTDGIYGPITTSAVRQFQSAHPPLKGTGAADAETQAAIAEAMKEDQNQEDVGRKLFALGGRSYERGKYGHAYAFFTRAGELADRPGIIFSRAQALRRLGGRREEAIALYAAYLAGGQAERAKDAEAALADLRTPGKTGDEDADRATAKKIFDHGAALYEAHDFAHAYDEFSRAGELYDRPGITFSRAQALRRLGGRSEEAIAL